ncbi:MAG: hemerythrin domain-containing protein [Gammaproteobacteria bacterium]|nr:hemerythrin domain-containing protein [Gammaproteobacteria bacterium]
MKRRAAAADRDMDAIAALTADHRKVRELFKQFKKLKSAEGAGREKAALVKQICTELTIHAAIEEEIFYPAVRVQIDDDDLMDEALVEHAGAKDLIAQLEGMDPGDDLYDAKVTVLGEQIDHHVEEEEGEIFPKAKKAKVDTEKLGAQLFARKAELKSELGEIAEEDDMEVPTPRAGTSSRDEKRTRSS